MFVGHGNVVIKQATTITFHVHVYTYTMYYPLCTAQYSLCLPGHINDRAVVQGSL